MSLSITSLIPLPYRVLGAAILVIGVLVAGRVYWDRSVSEAAQKVIQAYIQKKTKDDEVLQAIDTRTDAKIEIKYVDRVQTIIKTLPGTITTITNVVHDNEILSDSWICVHNATVNETDVTKCEK